MFFSMGAWGLVRLTPWHRAMCWCGTYSRGLKGVENLGLGASEGGGVENTVWCASGEEPRTGRAVPSRRVKRA
jgi:hypothetical protein